MADTIRFRWQDADVTVGMSQAGSGRSVVLLPALSSISTRGEMQPLLERLAPSCCVTSLDWPGFGDLPRPRVDWTPDLLSAFLNWVLDEVLTPPHAVVAAGHAGTYALYQAVHHPATIEDLVLIAPTWRGPLPTMMGGQRSWFARVRGAVDNPLIGPSLYRLNVSRPVIRRMAREHVYDDPEWLSGERMAAKRAVTRAAGARHASVRFVSGALDRVGSREAFLDLAQRVEVPILMVYGSAAPRRSRAEMAALGELPNVDVRQLPAGKLAVHEEYPEEVATAVASHLSG
ncbi:hypothetical protein BTO32_12210 [Marinobacter lutaoensis]|uniref:AB hydrolase-1 domain-containing protein n=1 Tax=Marinobacter lutaoensis TaxID=135739 RepID=A0A1V2DSY9_9GAMM|nr:alpha/beta hydrolase [Marinobacter lutaoensis]ONF43431.1 hypothetical protein BTO32_12210 [Marinobacter lutaoensis]